MFCLAYFYFCFDYFTFAVIYLKIKFHKKYDQTVFWLPIIFKIDQKQQFSQKKAIPNVLAFWKVNMDVISLNTSESHTG